REVLPRRHQRHIRTRRIRLEGQQRRGRAAVAPGLRAGRGGDGHRDQRGERCDGDAYRGANRGGPYMHGTASVSRPPILPYETSLLKRRRSRRFTTRGGGAAPP